MAQILKINRHLRIIRSNQLRQIFGYSRRLFSSLAPSSDSDDEDNNIPYLFLNTNANLIKIREETLEEDLIVWNKFMSPEVENEFGLRRKFSLMYFDLLKAVSENNL